MFRDNNLELLGDDSHKMRERVENAMHSFNVCRAASRFWPCRNLFE